MDPSADEIRLQLDRVLASGVFANADRMSGFLRYVVDRALAGEGDQVKEYVVGVAVFERTEAYDPRLDSIVRVEARRLIAASGRYQLVDVGAVNDRAVSAGNLRNCEGCEAKIAAGYFNGNGTRRDFAGTVGRGFDE